MSSETNKKYDENHLKMGISIWLSFCLFLCVWFLSRFVRGRRQLRRNLHIIEDGLRRMQEEVDRRQRENSLTYGQGNEQLSQLLQKHLDDKKMKQNEQQEQEEQQENREDDSHICDKNEMKQVDSTTTAIVDKKND